MIRRRGKTIMQAAAVGVVGLAARDTLAVHRKMAAVDPSMRHPLLRLHLDITSSLQLTIGRRLPPLPGTPAPTVRITNRTIHLAAGGPSVRIHEPSPRERPSAALLWIHGGGMILGTPEVDDVMLSHMAEELGILIVAARYRLAPEHPYPAALDDCMAALNWMHDAASELAIDRDRIAVGGGSAGGGLAAAVALRARDEGGPALCFQSLTYPMLDDRTVLRSDHGGRGEFLWTPRSNRYAWTCYLGQPPAEHDDRLYAAPARAVDLAGLPPAWIGTGGLDLFHDEDVDYAQRLEAAGVMCELLDEPCLYHGADTIVPAEPRMVAFRRARVDALRRALAHRQAGVS